MSFRPRKRARTRVAALALGLALLASGCGEDDADRKLGSGGEEVRIAVADPDSYRVFQPSVAEALGFLEDEGISLRMVDAGEEAAALTAVSEGDADLALVGAPAAIRSLTDGGDLRIVYESAPGNPIAIQVPCGDCTTNASVRFKRFAELTGHTLGIAGGEPSEDFLALALTRSGVPPGAIETKAIDGPGEARKALADGKIDAYLAPDELLDPETESTQLVPASVPSGVLVSTGATLEDRPGPIGRVLRAWARATYAAILNSTLSEALPERTTDLDTLDEAVLNAEPPSAGTEVSGERDGYAFAVIRPVGSDVFGELEGERLTELAATMSDAGLIGAPPDLGPVLDDRLIATANDFDRLTTWCRSRAWEQRNVEGSEDLKPCRPPG